MEKNKLKPFLHDTTQEWDDKKFCDIYEKTWEISTSEVHYGWLAPGEDVLELIKKECHPQVKVLDVGCGLGQNLIALAKKGAICFGLDISSCMLERANKIIKENDLEGAIALEQGDMRKLSAFKDIDFDIIISVYSMEYLSGVQELRKVIYNLNKRLKPGGVLIICFSHPSQAHRYPEIMNKSIPQGAGMYRTFNYSIKDAIECLVNAKFSVERVVEQQTINPSKIQYDDAKKYPYHFREGLSPLQEKYDGFSNSAPHTIIYKARSYRNPSRSFPRQHSQDVGVRELWGYKRKIVKYDSITYLGASFNVFHLAPMDNILGLVDILSFTVSDRDMVKTGEQVALELICNDEAMYISAKSVLGIVIKRLHALGLAPVYKISTVEKEVGINERKIFIESILGLNEMVKKKFNSSKIGLLTFINEHEPSMGELPLDIIETKEGDRIRFVYVAQKEDRQMRLI